MSEVGEINIRIGLHQQIHQYRIHMYCKGIFLMDLE